MVFRLVLICCIVWLLVSVLSVLMNGLLLMRFYSFFVLCLVSVCLIGIELCRWIMFLVK